MLRPTGPKVEACWAEANFWGSVSWRRPKREVQRRVAPNWTGTARPRGPNRHAVFYMLRPAGPKVEARRAEAKFWVWLFWLATVLRMRCQRARFWLCTSYHAKGCFQGNQHVTLSSIVCLRDFPSHRSVLPPCGVPIPCIIAEKPLKMAYFSKTGSRNMTETCAIDFSYPTSYSTSIPIGGLAFCPF